jgi:hypothetical protein
MVLSTWPRIIRFYIACQRDVETYKKPNKAAEMSGVLVVSKS